MIKGWRPSNTLETDGVLLPETKACILYTTTIPILSIYVFDGYVCLVRVTDDVVWYIK